MKFDDLLTGFFANAAIAPKAELGTPWDVGPQKLS
jgi:hypothetical protein